MSEYPEHDSRSMLERIKLCEENTVELEKRCYELEQKLKKVLGKQE